MAFSSDFIGTFPVSRSKRLSFGSFTNTDTDTGGSIDTGLKYVDAIFFSFGSHFGTENPKWTVSGGTVTLVTDYAVDGYWMALGL